jgi:hypothetical protein
VSDLDTLPGGEIVARGLEDLREGHDTIPALVVAIASRRLRELGVPVPEHDITDANLALYRALDREDPRGTHSRYNALVRRLTSFIHALERERGRARRTTSERGRP